MDAQRRFRDVLGAFPTGVAIVTARGPDGPTGLTTNAVASLSLDPLLVVVCFDLGSRTLAAVRERRRFAVNVLRSGHADLAARFATKRAGAEKFAGVAHHDEAGSPVLDEALAWVACELRDLHPGGDHAIGVGAVLAMGDDPDGTPLVFERGRYAEIVAIKTTPG